jgi:hypothetical protein
MNVNVFLPEDGSLRASLERVLSAYPGLFRVRWLGPADGESHLELLLASFPLDEATGHGARGEGDAADYAGYGYLAPAAESRLPAIAIYDRLALVTATGGPPRRLRPGVWEAPLHLESVLRPAFHLVLEDALAQVRHDYARLRLLSPRGLDERSAAERLGVTREALRRALRR